MSLDTTKIITHLCYTELVYGRINKKLNINLSNSEIEALILSVLMKTDTNHLEKIGKNFYISNLDMNIRITINSYTYRVITVDQMNKL